jgi:hypothetical protein
MSTEKILTPDYFASCLQEYVAILQIGQFPETAQILKCFAKVIQAEAANGKFYDENYPKLETALRREFCLGTNWQPRLFDDTDAIIKEASLDPEKLLMPLKLMELTNIRQENVNKIMFAARKETDEVSRIYLLCFVYLLLLEGIYDEFMRFLYALHKRLPTTKADLDSIRTQFSKDGVGATLFDGWNRIVRNGIAHSTFTVDDTAKQVLFEDREKKELMSFSDFEELTRKLFEVGTAVLVLLILRVLIPLNYRDALKSQSTSRKAC